MIKIKLFDILIALSSVLLYPPSVRVRTSDPAVDSLAGVYTKTEKSVSDFRPEYRYKENYIYYEGKNGKNNLFPFSYLQSPTGTLVGGRRGRGG